MAVEKCSGDGKNVKTLKMVSPTSWGVLLDFDIFLVFLGALC